MGSWYGTCALSNLPIVGDNPAYLLILQSPAMEIFEDKENQMPWNYQWTHHWSALGPPIVGNYWDCGQIELPQTFEELTYPERCTFQRLIDGGWQGSLQELHEKCVISKSSIRNLYTFNITSILILKDVWEEYLQLKSKNLQELKDSAKEWLNFCFDKCEKFSKNQDYKIFIELSCSYFIYQNRFCQIDYGKFSLSWWRAKIADNLIKDLQNNQPKDSCLMKYQELCNSLAELIHITLLLEDCRRGWAPTFGAGSQDCYLDMHQKMIEINMRGLERAKQRYIDRD